MTLAVLGGAGYIGSHVVKFLHRQGVPLVVYDNLSHGHADAVVAGVPLVQGELGDRARLTTLFQEYGVTTVMNFAGLIAVGESVREPRRYYATNVADTLTLLDTMLDCGVRAFIFSSTCAVYGLPHYLPLDEAHPYNPVSPYGSSKLAIERVLADYARAYDFHYVSLRYFNASGADPDGELGERHDPETHLIPLILEAATGQREAIQIFGSDYDTPDGTCIRDYIHVWDLAQAHQLAWQFLREQRRSEVFNLGNGAGHSVREVIAAAERVVGHRIPVQEKPRREGDPPVLIGSSQKALELLRWQPAYADLDVIMQSAWRWSQRPR